MRAAFAKDRARGPFLAGTLGVAALGLAAEVVMGDPPVGGMQQEIIVTAARHADAVLAARVTAVLHRNPYIFSDHVSVTADQGVIRITGVVRDLPDLFAILRLARSIAGNGRVVNEIEYVPVDDDGN